MTDEQLDADLDSLSAVINTQVEASSESFPGEHEIIRTGVRVIFGLVKDIHDIRTALVTGGADVELVERLFEIARLPAGAPGPSAVKKAARAEPKSRGGSLYEDENKFKDRVLKFKDRYGAEVVFEMFNEAFGKHAEVPRNSMTGNIMLRDAVRFPDYWFAAYKWMDDYTHANPK